MSLEFEIPTLKETRNRIMILAHTKADAYLGRQIDFWQVKLADWQKDMIRISAQYPAQHGGVKLTKRGYDHAKYIYILHKAAYRLRNRLPYWERAKSTHNHPAIVYAADQVVLRYLANIDTTKDQPLMMAKRYLYGIASSMGCLSEIKAAYDPDFDYLSKTPPNMPTGFLLAGVANKNVETTIRLHFDYYDDIGRE